MTNNIFLKFNKLLYSINHDLFERKIPISHKNYMLNKKQFKTKIIENPKTLFAYIYDKKKKFSIIFEYSKNQNVILKLIDYLFIKETLEFDQIYDFFINKSDAIGSDFQNIIPTNTKDFDDLLSFAKEYKIKELETLLVGKQATYVQNIFS